MMVRPYPSAGAPLPACAATVLLRRRHGVHRCEKGWELLSGRFITHARISQSLYAYSTRPNFLHCCTFDSVAELARSCLPTRAGFFSPHSQDIMTTFAVAVEGRAPSLTDIFHSKLTTTREQHASEVQPPIYSTHYNTPILNNDVAIAVGDESDLDDLDLDLLLAGECLAVDYGHLAAPSAARAAVAKRPRDPPQPAQPTFASSPRKRSRRTASLGPLPEADAATPEPVLQTTPAPRRKAMASYNKARCSAGVFLPGARYGICGICGKLLLYTPPVAAPGERLSWFASHAEKGKNHRKDCGGCEPALREQWHREDWEGAPRSDPSRPTPPPLSEIRFFPGA